MEAMMVLVIKHHATAVIYNRLLNEESY